MAGFGSHKSNNKKKITSKKTPERNGEDLFKQGINYQIQGDLHSAEKAYQEAINCGYINSGLFSNLGVIYQTSNRASKAITLFEKAIQIDPSDPTAHMNLGGIYKNLGNLDQALASTLKSLELKSDNPDALMNLGGIYKDRGHLDKALASTLKSLELKPDSPGAVNNLQIFIEQLNFSPSNAKNLIRAYELLINKTDISHRKFTPIFLQAFLPTIQKAASSDPIISEDNEAFKALASDWRFLKSLTQ